ncbi:MAG: Uma2 family endonuclease, partial [Nitrospirae bacterium]|nr:Uma2 family endonuclease [Nitrospirota bacterium]
MATAAKTRSVKFTYEDYLLFPEDGRRREIIDGELYNADIALGRSPSLKHQRTSANLLETLNAFVRPDGVGMIVQAPFDVVFPNENVVQPDLSFVSTARVSIIAKKCIQGPPDLIVEILAEETWRLDETIKRKLYAEALPGCGKSLLSPCQGERARVRGLRKPPILFPSPQPSPRGRGGKRGGSASFYERHGVPEYWIVDPELETVKVFRMTDQGYVRAAELSRESGDALSTP